MKIAKKTLSVFLSLLMIFSACSVGLFGVITASAAPGDSAYEHDEVDALVKAAAAKGAAHSSGNAYSYTGDDGSVLAAAEAVFDYATKKYRKGRAPTDKANSSDTLYSSFMAEFGYGTASPEGLFVKDILYPNGTNVYGYENALTSTYNYNEVSESWGSVGADVTGKVPDSAYNTAVQAVSKTVSIDINLNAYLKTFNTIDDIPSSFLESVKYTYAHATGKSAVLASERTNDGGTCGDDTYSGTANTSAWNYMSAKPSRVVVKNKTTKKQLLSIEKFFDAERLATTFDSMLEMSASDIETYYLTAVEYFELIENNFTKDIIDHFNLNYDGIVEFMDNLEFAYRVVVGKYSIDILLDYIGTDYNEESYAEMSALYTKVSTAYDVVDTMRSEVADYIVANGYEEKYNDVQDIMDEAEIYIATLYDIMIEQRLEELVDSMVVTYNEYYDQLNKEDIETPSDAEIVGLVQKVDGYNSVLATYPTKDYYRTYWSTDYEAAWNDFCAKLDEVAEVRDIKISFNTYYEYFMPLLFTTMIVDLDDDAALDLHQNFQTNVDNLVASYNECVSTWGKTIADKIFTISYDGQDYLLQNLLESLSQKELEDNLVARTEAQIDAVMVYSGVTVVNFDNFADIKSTLTHFNYDLYDYVTEKGWLSTDYTNKYSQVQTLLDKYHAFTTTDGKAFFNENFTYADENGLYATRYAGDQTVEVTDPEDGETGEVQIGYPGDIARDNEDKNGDGVADDNYLVTEEKLLDTVVKIDNFIVSRDFGALVGLVDSETEEATDLKTYVNQMLEEMLYTDEMMNTLVGAIFPMLVELINTELLGMLADMGTPTDPAANGAIDLSTMSEDLEGSSAANLYLDDARYNGTKYQRYLYEVFADLELYIYPTTLADSLAISNPASYGVGSEIYTALKAAGRDWSQLVCEDDETTVDVDETKALEFVWGVYDEESFMDTLSCILDSILPLLQAALAGASYSGYADNAAYAFIDKLTYNLGFIPLSVSDVAANGAINLSIEPLHIYTDVLVPLFEVLGVENIPTLNTTCSSEDIVDAIFGTLLDRVDEILDAPLASILDILPNLVYFLSMDSVQEMINSLNITLNLAFEVEIDGDNSGTLASILGAVNIEGLINDMLQFPVELAISDMLDLYDLLGFEITNFNEILDFVLDMTGLGIKLPELKQQEIIFCSDWGTNAAGRVDLEANKGDIIYWFLNYLVSAVADGELLNSLLGEDMDPTVSALINKLVSQIAGNQDDALAAIIELLNPVEYDLTEMEWIEQGDWDYDEIEGANQMSIVYLNYGNDWTRADAEYLVDNIDSLVASILKMANVEIDDLGAFLQDSVNSLFTNENITALVKMLGSLGDSASAVVNDIVANQIGINLESWFIAFGYLFPADTWKEDAEVIQPGSRYYVNNFGVEGIANEDGTISWFFNKMPLVDGDGYTFVNILSRLLGEASLLVEFLLAGEDVSAFNELLTIKGYETYDTSLGLLLAMLGVENLPTQADFNADAMGSLSNMLTATLDWFYTLTDSDDMITQLLELLPDLFYYIESNGLSTLLHNLLMPVLVVVDTVRPLLDVDINGVLSLLVSDLLNYGTIDLDVILQYLIYGIYVNDDPEYKYISIDVNNITVSEIVKIADQFLGTNLYESGLVQIGVKGLCSGVETVENTSVGTIYRPTVDAADTVTILVTAVLDCLSYPVKDTDKANGDVICEFIADATGNEAIADLYPAIASILEGIDIEYGEPNWGYMFDSPDKFSLELPEQSIVYLGYSTDWTKETADSVYSVLDEVLDLVLPELLDEGETIATLLNGLLEDEVYTDEILNTLVELIVNALADFDKTLLDLVDCVVSTDISAWFTFCELDETTGEYVCTYDWGVDEAAEADKKDIFVAGIKEVLEPANELLAWLFFGGEYAFFTGSETDAEGNYTYNDVLTLNGGEGYAYGLVPILEALGCEVAAPETFYNAENDSYDVGAAVENILDSVLDLVDEISANPVEEVFTLLPNLIYFINADGLKVSVNNLLAPVNSIIEKLSPIISDGDETVSIGGLLEDAIGLNISDISMDTLLGFAGDAGFVLSSDMIDIICNLYVGKLAEFDSVNGRTAYKLDITGYEGDVLTLILSIALDAFNLNADLFSDLLGEDIYYAVYELIRGASEAFVYRDMNWAYMYDGEDAASQLYNNNLPERTGDSYQIYTQYQNNWNKETADYLDSVLDQLVKDITDAVRSDGSSLGMILDDAITGGIYQDDILNSLIEMVVELLVDYEDLVKGAGALLGAEGLAVWFDDYCEITTDENGETVVTCTKDWGIDSAATNEAKREAFVDGFVTALEPAYRLLAWLLFGEDYTFLNGTTNEVLITLTGGEGYDNALVPLLEGLSCTMNYEGTVSGIKPASAYYDDQGNLDMEQAVRDVFTAVTDLLHDICGDLDGEGSIGTMLDILPNVLYFVNADGLKVVVNNLLVPVNNLLDALEPMGVELDLNELIGIEGFDVYNLDFYSVYALLEDLLGLYFPEYTQDFLATFYIGQVVPYESANGKLAYYMTYSDKEPRRDMITCLISLVVDVFIDERNDECLIDWMGSDIYYGILDVLKISKAKDMQKYEWLYTEYADTDTAFNATETSVKYEAAYNNIWTRDKAEYIADNLLPFVNNLLGLIGLEINGIEIRSIDNLLDSLLDGNLYTQATADSLLDLLRDLLDQIEGLEPYGKYITNILDKALGVDLNAWNTMTVTVEDGNRDSFIAALEQMLSPVVPLLNVLLCGENIELFYTIDGSNEAAITIYGSEGYAYGIIPLFEALGCTMMAPDAFAELSNEDKAGALLESLLDRVDVILADPVNEIFAMIPELIYFINSKGLDAAVNNILNSVDTVLIALEPLIGATSLMELLGVELAEFDFDYIINLACEAIEDSTGLDVEPLIIDFVAELTMGKVVSYQSANGETYYKMVYAGESQMADMVTVLLRLLIDFLATGDNADAIIALISGNSESEDAANSASTLINFVLTAANTEPITSGAMATLYWIFYGLNNGVEGLDYLYGNYGKSWDALVGFFEENDESYLDKAADVLKAILKEFAGIDTDSSVKDCDCNCHSNSAFIRFFFKIINFLRRIFGMSQYQYCGCGAAHW